MTSDPRAPVPVASAVSGLRPGLFHPPVDLELPLGRAPSPALAALMARVAPARTAAELAAALAGELTFDDVRGFVRFSEARYVRALIFRSEQVELRLLCWLPGQASMLHGHPSACAFRVLRGMATEVVLGERDRVWAPGAIVSDDGPRIHQIENRERDPLLTLHAYSPPLPDESTSPPGTDSIVIVGGGLSGVAVAYHLLARGGPTLRVDLVEAGPWLGRGIAYGVESEVFTLNVPASRMSLDPDDPASFVRFAGAEADPSAFLPRALYGRYVTERLGAALGGSRARLQVHRDVAVAIDGERVALASGKVLPARAVVLATGVSTRVLPGLAHPRAADAWDECALSTLPPKGRMLLLGSGLTALDVLAFLDAQGFAGEVTMVSPWGLLPAPHLEPLRPVPALDQAAVAAAPTELAGLVRWGRALVRQAERAGLPWQAAIDALRPHVTRLYRALSPRDRARFVRHVRPFWDVLRHRAPVAVLARVAAWEKAGRLRRIAGRVRVLGEPEASGGALAVEIRPRTGPARRETFHAMVRCIGPALDVAEGRTPLLRSLLEGGLGRLVEGGLGIETDPEGRVVNPAGERSPGLWAIGSARRACDWETTSVPDIAVHAHEIARALIGA